MRTGSLALGCALVCVGVGLAHAEAAWRYEVTAGDGARELRVEATLAAGSSEELSVDDGAEPFVDGVELESNGAWIRIAPKKDVWIIPACQARGCRLRYRFRLADAAEKLDNDVAQRLGEVLEAPPSTWLLHPLHPRAGLRYRFHVKTTAPLGFVSGVHAADGAPDAFEADAQTLPDAPYSGFGAFTVRRLPVAGGALTIAFSRAPRRLSDDDVLAWLARGAHSVEAYFGKFPVPRALVMVLPGRGHGVNGRTMGTGGATLMLFVGEAVDAGDVRDDWVVTHEMVHLGFPTVPWPQLWMAEGLATYVEPLARVRTGEVSVEKMWRDLVDGLPQGQPGPGDHGLDHTHSWGRTYWGGALFCLVADVEIRRRTDGKRSLEDALRGIVDGGGTLETSMTLDDALRLGDRAVGAPVLEELRRRYGDHPERVDLDGLWRRLGVRLTGGRIAVDDAAPLAALRRAITAVPRAR